MQVAGLVFTYCTDTVAAKYNLTITRQLQQIQDQEWGGVRLTCSLEDKGVTY